MQLSLASAVAIMASISSAFVIDTYSDRTCGKLVESRSTSGTTPARHGQKDSHLSRSEPGEEAIRRGTSLRPITAEAFLGQLARVMWTPQPRTTRWMGATASMAVLRMRLLHTLASRQIRRSCKLICSVMVLGEKLIAA